MMQQAIALARQGMGRVSPNPLVGCIITNEKDEIIGEGAHLDFGGPHAEPNAIKDAESKGYSVEGATVYVTLEPHSHQGKTPPCSKLLVEKKIRRCVIATEDPNPKVNGNGIRDLREAGIEVEIGLLKEEAEEQNRFFIKHVTTGLPYVTLKVASSLDGRSALASGESKWITSEASRTIVHQMRAEHDAVLVGTRTAAVDDPSLTVRHIEGRHPTRIVLDPLLELSPHLTVFTDDIAPTIVITSHGALDRERKKSDDLAKRGIEIIAVDSSNDRLDLRGMLKELGKRAITSVLAEAGPTLAASFVQERLFDELAIFYGPLLLGADARATFGPLELSNLDGASRLQIKELRSIEHSQDFLIRLRP